MIDWMQKHKNYLLITIWISTIAFIGAGSTGWGSYNPVSSSQEIASVGDYSVRYKELNIEYGRLFSRMQQQNPTFNEKSAKKMKLEQTALQNLINRKYLLNFANELEMITTPDEIFESILQNGDFHIDGKFSTTNYKKILSQANITPTDYEHTISENILLAKVLKIFDTDLSEIEKELANINTGLQDKVKIQVLDMKKIKIKHTKKELKDFWNENKAKYKTNKKYIASVLEIKYKNKKPNEKDIKDFYKNNKLRFEDKDGKIQKLEKVKEKVIQAINKDKAFDKAKKAFYDIKNNKTTTKTTLTFENRGFMTSSAYKEISKYKKNEYFKPIELPNSYMVGIVKDVLEPREKTFKEAKKTASYQLIQKMKMDKLVKKAEKQVKTFKGKNVGYISKKEYSKLEKFNLGKYESNNFIFQLMKTEKKQGYFIIDKKAILYKITAQKLPKNKNDTLKLDGLDKLKNIAKNDDTLLNIKSNLIETGMLDYFKNKYKVSYKNNIASN